jgi:hypothetical protein
MSVTSGEFSVHKPNRQEHEWFGGLRNIAPAAVSQPARLSPKAMHGEAKPSN